MLKDKLFYRYVGAIAALAIISLLSSWSGLPSQHEISNSWDGLLWGIADPVLAFDMLVSIVVIGLLARREWIAIALILVNISWFQGHFISESIATPGTMPLIWYVFGAVLTQYAVVMSAKEIGTKVSILSKKINLVGFVICALGVVCLKSLIN
jgi:urease accessory protein